MYCVLLCKNIYWWRWWFCFIFFLHNMFVLFYFNFFFNFHFFYLSFWLLFFYNVIHSFIHSMNLLYNALLVLLFIRYLFYIIIKKSLIGISISRFCSFLESNNVLCFKLKMTILKDVKTIYIIVHSFFLLIT